MTLYRTRYVIDVLHEDAIPENWELTDIIQEGYTGSYVLDVTGEQAEELPEERMRAALIKSGSTPDFFSLDDDDTCVQAS